MRIFTSLLTISAAMLAAGTALAETQRCVRGDDVRTLEVITPGVVGAACDLNYVRGENTSVPYHANNSAGYCAEKAIELAASLTASGFECAALGGGDDTSPDTEEQDAAVLDDPDAAPVIDYSEAPLQPSFPAIAGTETEISPGSLLSREGAVFAAGSGDSRSTDEMLEQPPAPQRFVAEAELDGAAPPAAINDSLSVPTAPSAPVASGPMVLSTTNASASPPALVGSGPSALSTSRASSPSPALAPVVGRIAGAAATARQASPVYSAPAEERLRLTPTIAAAPASVKSAAARASPTAGVVRTPEELIKDVLSAQVAAWNDGDLDAFMRGYWNSPNLRFVSGTTVSKGWNQTLKRYRDRYGDGADLGRLGFDGLDVEMLNDDVAVLVGRYNLVRDGTTSTGLFTLVMKRFDGLWRIVHDHTVDDTPTTE